MRPADACAAIRDATDEGDRGRSTNRRVAEMRRRPRIREADEHEDDSGTGTWVIRTDEPQESVEDPFGLRRPTDCADNADPEGLGDSLSELPEARVVRTGGRVKEILRAGEDLPRTVGTTGMTARPGESHIPSGTSVRAHTVSRVRSYERARHPLAIRRG